MPRWRLFYHVVWATDGRRALLTPQVELAAQRELRGIAGRYGIVVHAIGGIEDHIHLAISIPPRLSVADAIQRLKGSSSHALRAEFGESFRWQNEYSADTFSARHLQHVVAYINNQRRHHNEHTTILELEH